MNNKLTDKELDILLKSLVIVVDTKEKVNNHVTDYFNKKKIRYITKSLSSGDYSCYIESHDGIYDDKGKLLLEETKSIIGSRNMWFNSEIAIERKNSVNELASSIKDRDRFTNEFDRATVKGTRMLVFVEDNDGISNIIKGKYQSEYQPKALYASLKTFEARYNFQTKFISKELIGMEIYYSLKYYVREQLK